ncbi:hypothetical protein L612_003800000150 [Rhodococcus rhodochrous J38]|jgi:hypothetical protein|nr:hypothetical protein L612_003800000150 [Rhodococcus rhodochrous J38]
MSQLPYSHHGRIAIVTAAAQESGAMAHQLGAGGHAIAALDLDEAAC